MQPIFNMPTVSLIVIMVILALFAFAVIMLFAVCAAYRREIRLAADGNTNASRLLRHTYEDFTEAYKCFGTETNTPAIITGAIGARMRFYLFCERFLSNAVSLFVTLGLFGTFLGLSMSVSSLTELLGASNSSEWLGILDNVGSGLMSALSGMGVAFYTSLVGVACSILLTILRSILSPETLRATMETEIELWLDHRIAPTVKTDKAMDDTQLIDRLIQGLGAVTDEMEKGLRAVAETMGKSLKTTTDTMDRSLKAANETMSENLKTANDAMERNFKLTNVALVNTLDKSVLVVKAFNESVNNFNKGSRDFNEFDYNLRGTVEKLDLTVRDLRNELRSIKGGN